MRLAVSNIAWTLDERLDAYALLQDNGFRGLEIAPGVLFDGLDDPFCPSPAQVNQVLKETARFSLNLVSMQSLLHGAGDAALFGTPAQRSIFETGMRRAIDLARRLGIPVVVFGSPRQRIISEGMTPDAAWQSAATVFRRLGDVAAQVNVEILVEANPAVYGTNFLNRLEEAAAFVDLVDHPGVQLILDLGAMYINGQFDITTRRIAELAARIRHVHVSEPDLLPAPAQTGHAVEVLRALSGVGYQGAVSIEMRRPGNGLEELATSVRRLAGAAVKAGTT